MPKVRKGKSKVKKGIEPHELVLYAISSMLVGIFTIILYGIVELWILGEPTMWFTLGNFRIPINPVEGIVTFGLFWIILTIVKIWPDFKSD